jgi:transposase InsO family protein
MEVHARAPLSPIGRRRVIERVVLEAWSVAAAAAAAGVTERTVYRWLARWRAEGPRGLIDRRSVPRHIPHRTAPERVAAICALRRLHLTGAEIAEALGMALSTVSAVLLREGMGKRSRLTPAEPPNRYERRRPGELVHIDIKKLGRIVVPGHRVTGNRRQAADRTRIDTPDGRKLATAGWEFVHVAVDDHSRLAYAEVLPDQTATSAIAFLRHALAFYGRHGITVERVMTDNGSAYRAHKHRLACHQLALKHITTRPYRPRTNGKAERFIQTLTRRWAHGQLYANSTERTAALPAWLAHYNYTRPHGSLGHKPPGSRLTKAPRNDT